MAGATRSNKDKEMASHMKQKGVDRHTARCPICNAMVSVARVARQAIAVGMYHHIVTCGGRSRRAEHETRPARKAA